LDAKERAAAVAAILEEARRLPAHLKPGTPQRAAADAALIKAIDALPAPVRAAFCLHFVSGMTREDVMKQLGVTLVEYERRMVAALVACREACL
jgi:DNA-directed RNA polymerase specialized sigma24 family protein